ncbi:MAG: PIN domain-containing protein [Candidatus Dojkabacteria bacterium]|nr:PIN domain-containing protein [Candidatus Dojkabacteria bacterium]MDQ7020701.1 PIN domain-containing protein [Candidatus Dojkabacteria bacterium]
MKSKILVDIGIIVEYLKTGKGDLPGAYEKHKMLITPLTYSELLASETFKDETLEKEVLEFIGKYFEVIVIDEKVASQTAQILRSNNLTMVSAVNAATAVVNKIALLTDDEKSYNKVEGLDFAKL